MNEPLKFPNTVVRYNFTFKSSYLVSFTQWDSDLRYPLVNNCFNIVINCIIINVILVLIIDWRFNNNFKVFNFLSHLSSNFFLGKFCAPFLGLDLLLFEHIGRRIVILLVVYIVFQTTTTSAAIFWDYLSWPNFAHFQSIAFKLFKSLTMYTNIYVCTCLKSVNSINTTLHSTLYQIGAYSR